MKKRQKSEKLNNETIFELYNNINSKDCSQDNLTKLLIRDFLYEKYFYNYTFNVLKKNNGNSHQNLRKENYYKIINEKKSNDYQIDNYNNSNIKTDESTQNNYLDSLGCYKTQKVINIKQIKINNNDNIIINNNSLYNTILDRNNKPNILNSNINNQYENFKNNINSLSVDFKNSSKMFENKIINTIPTIEQKKNKIRLTKLKPCNIYDPLAFDKFNNYFKINFRRQYLMPNFSNI